MKPQCKLNPPAAQQDTPNDRTVEFSFPAVRDSAGLPVGGLLHLNGAHTSVSLYRLDPQVRVYVPAGAQLVQGGLQGSVVQHGDIATLLVAAVQLMQLRPELMTDPDLHAVMQWYVRNLPQLDRDRVATALAELVAHHYASGGDVDPLVGARTAPGFSRWRMLAAELRASAV